MATCGFTNYEIQKHYNSKERIRGICQSITGINPKT